MNILLNYKNFFLLNFFFIFGLFAPDDSFSSEESSNKTLSWHLNKIKKYLNLVSFEIDVKKASDMALLKNRIIKLQKKLCNIYNFLQQSDQNCEAIDYLDYSPQLIIDLLIEVYSKEDDSRIIFNKYCKGKERINTRYKIDFLNHAKVAQTLFFEPIREFSKTSSDPVVKKIIKILSGLLIIFPSPEYL